MNASGTTTCKFTKCDITPVAVETCKVIVADLINDSLGPTFLLPLPSIIRQGTKSSSSVIGFGADTILGILNGFLVKETLRGRIRTRVVFVVHNSRG